MTYPQAGDLIATHSHGLVGRLIRLGEKISALGWRRTIWRAVTHQDDAPSDPWYFNHIAVYVGHGYVIEALAAGLTHSPLAKYREFRVLPLDSVLWLPTSLERSNALTFAAEQLRRHDKYGWLSIVSIVAEILTPTRLDISWDGALICSAFGAQTWEHAGVTLPTKSSLTIKPSDLVALAAGGAHGLTPTVT